MVSTLGHESATDVDVLPQPFGEAHMPALGVLRWRVRLNVFVVTWACLLYGLGQKVAANLPCSERMTGNPEVIHFDLTSLMAK